MNFKEKESVLYKIRHSTAHVLMQAIQRLFINVKPNVGPVNENGFFYDLYSETPIKEADLDRIEQEMHKIVAENHTISGKQVSKEEARKIYHNNPFKLEIIDRIETETVGIYSQGEFFDLCQGFHTESTGEIGNFKLTGIAGNYWKGDKNNIQLQRISGVAFETAAELKEYFERLELAKQFDHRLLGKELDLFSFFSESPGMVFLHPKGLTLYNLLIEHSRKIKKKYGFVEIKTPVVLKEELWHESGHYENYRENMFFCHANEEKYCVRPMNCPCAILLYREGLHSYKELPIRLAEYGLVHRYELSGVLHGLFRVRAFTQDDSHIFCMPSQVQDEVRSMLRLATETYNKFGFSDFRIAVSTRPEKCIGDLDAWNTATEILYEALKAESCSFFIKEGEGAFYGPKIELLIKDSLGREWQCGTIQIDFFLPQRFKINYVASDQNKQSPVMIHLAVLGSLERFMGICIEHHRGKFPLWLAPIQTKILTITNNQEAYGQAILQHLSEAGIRAELDTSNETVSAKIRKATVEKVPTMIIIGAKEQASETLTLRYPDGTQITNLTKDQVMGHLQQ